MNHAVLSLPARARTCKALCTTTTPYLEPHEDQHPIAALGVVPCPQLQANFLQVQPGTVLGDAVVVLCVGDELQRQQGDTQAQGIGENLGRGSKEGGQVARSKQSLNWGTGHS